jgi:hypothetical protein
MRKGATAVQAMLWCKPASNHPWPFDPHLTMAFNFMITPSHQAGQFIVWR